MPRKKITVNGKSYDSISEAARHRRLNPVRVAERLRDGWTIDEAFELVVRPPSKPKRRKPVSINANGNSLSFDTVKDAALWFGLVPGVVRNRMTVHNWTLEQALELEPRERRTAPNRKKVEFCHNGQNFSFPSVTHAAEAFGLNEFLVFGRINGSGWDIKQALELTAPPQHANFYFGYIYLITNKTDNKQYVGQTMRLIEERWASHIQFAMRQEKVSEESITFAIQKFGEENFSIEQIDSAEDRNSLNHLERYWIKKLSTRAPSGYNLSRGGSGVSKGQTVTLSGRSFQSISEAAREYGISPPVASDRMRSGWTIEQALELETAPESGKFAGRQVHVNTQDGVLRFNSIGEFARHYKLPVPRVMQRITSMNWTPEQACGIEPPPLSKYSAQEILIFENGKEKKYRSIASAAAYHNIPMKRVYSRLQRGWTIERALEISEYS